MARFLLHLKTSGFSRSVRLKTTCMLKPSERTALAINFIIRMSRHKRTIKTLSHCYYEMKYHIVWTPKYRGKALSAQKPKDELRRTFESITKWKHWEIIELNIQDDHIHLILSASPRDSVSYMMQMIKGKSSAWMKKKIKRTHGLYDKASLWARGYFVSTIGLDEMIIRRYVKHQSHHNQVDQPSLFEKLVSALPQTPA